MGPAAGASAGHPDARVITASPSLRSSDPIRPPPTITPATSSADIETTGRGRHRRESPPGGGVKAFVVPPKKKKKNKTFITLKIIQKKEVSLCSLSRSRSLPAPFPPPGGGAPRPPAKKQGESV
mmetsp:Transcript_21946/g.70659  ORF Transcript_21946/g.70659 Transcript_21946/m.70659 type:complete len:124 (-) Transcript_21946:333-704(-)